MREQSVVRRSQALEDRLALAGMVALTDVPARSEVAEASRERARLASAYAERIQRRWTRRQAHCRQFGKKWQIIQ